MSLLTASNPSYKPTMHKERDIALDGVRGMAALCVVFSHVASMTWTPFYDRREPGLFEWGLWHLGAPAVDMFFLLSGYVVTRSLLRRPGTYGNYLLSRGVRLYPIAWMAVIAGALLRFANLPLIPGTSLILANIKSGVDALDIIGLMTFIAPLPPVNNINAPLWTLFVEMQAALAMPLLAFCARRNPRWLLPLGILGTIMVGGALGRTYPFYFAGFILGAALAGGEDQVVKAPKPLLVMIFFLPVLLLRHIMSSDDAALRVICAIGALGVLLSIRQGAANGMLTSRPSQFLGRISYPLYAVHWPVMVAFTLTGGAAYGITLSAFASMPVSILVAWMLSRMVDEPATRLARILR